MARPKLHHTSTWPWIIRRGDWHNAARYAEDPPLFRSEWLQPLQPISSDGRVGARTRCGKLLPIARFAPTYDTVTCLSCINHISVFGELRWGQQDPTRLEDLPTELQYLQICRSPHCETIVGPDQTHCDECSSAIRTGDLNPTEPRR